MASINPLEGCTVVWLCPLEVEHRAAIAMLDRQSSEIPPRVPGQNVIYTVGDIGPHRVAVVGYYQEQGLAVSGSIAAEVKRDLPNLQFGLLVGIAGGIPSPTHDIQLGDVAVAVPEDDCPGVVGYDLGKELDDGRFELKHWQNSTDPMLRSAIGIVRAQYPQRFERHLAVMESRTEFQRPNSDLPRTEVHYGTILSGNTVIKSKAKRDQLRSQYGGIAVEMEAAGMMTRLPVTVIRGISDFADASKNKEWQPYAAIAAAAYAKEVLLNLPPEIQKGMPHDILGFKQPHTPTDAETHSHVQNPVRELGSAAFANQDLRLAQSLPESWAFVGRTEEMAFLENELGMRAHRSIQKLVVGLWGLAGVGKSQLAARFVSKQRFDHPERQLFWLNCESQESFERSIASMLKPRSGPGLSLRESSAGSSIEDRRRLVNLFRTSLNSLEDARWLLVIDGIAENPSPAVVSSDIEDFLANLTRGCVLVTSRRRDLVARYYPCQQVEGLNTDDAIELVQQEIPPHLIGKGAKSLAMLLNGLPLALRLATSIIAHYRCTVDEYLETWERHGQAPRILGTDDVLSQSLALSFEGLEKNEPTAAKILTLFSFLHHGDLWFELCHNADEDIYPDWLQDLAREKASFKAFCPILADLSFIQQLRRSNADSLVWEMHPVVQMVARQRASPNEQDYIRWAIALVASQVPRSFEANSWETTRRLWPHVEMCWGYIKQGRWGPNTDYTDLESLARVFRRIGRYQEASLIYQKIGHDLSHCRPTRENAEFLADVLTNHGLVYTRQWKFDQALDCFDTSSRIMSQLSALTPDMSFSLMYNAGVVFRMMGRLDEAEGSLRRAATHFSQQTYELPLSGEKRKDLYLRILNDLGEVLMQQGAVGEALNLFHHVYNDQEASQGALHPNSVSLKLRMGRAMGQLDRFPEARGLLLTVIEVYTQWWGRCHQETMKAIDELAFVLMREFEEKRAFGEGGGSEIRMADKLWNEVLAFYRSVDGDESEGVARIEENLHFIRTSRL